MKVEVRHLNSGEIFPCSVKSAKSIFHQTDVTLNFAQYGRDFGTFSNTPDRFFVQRNIKGRVIACMYAHVGVAKAMLSFYVIKQMDYGLTQIERFEKECLPRFYDFYNQILNSDDIFGTCYTMFVELLNGNLNVYTTKNR